MRLEISKVANFENDSSSKSQNFIDVCMVGNTNLPLTIQTSVNFCNFAELYIFAHFRHIAVKPGNFTNTFYSNLSSGVNEIFSNLSTSKGEKAVKGSMV